MFVDTRSRNLPNGDVAARQHPRIHRRRQQGQRNVDAAVVSDRLPRKRLALRLPDDSHGELPHDGADGAHHRHRLGAPAHGHRRHLRQGLQDAVQGVQRVHRQARHRPPRSEEQEHPREGQPELRHRRLGSCRSTQPQN